MRIPLKIPRGSALWRKPALRAALIGLALIATISTGLMVVLGGAGYSARFAALCGACHEMSFAVNSWQESTHAKTSCYSCHDAMYAWYDLPRTLFGGESMFRRSATERLESLRYRVTGERAAQEEPPPYGHPVPVATSDAVCLECHTLWRTPTVRDAVIINHEDHARANDSCLSCHSSAIHPVPGVDIGLSTMAECYQCHNLDPEVGAPGTCETCHPDHFDLLPVSHVDTAAWTEQHGPDSLVDPASCLMCHMPQMCIDCHLIEMPHPEDFLDPRTGHAAQRFEDRTVCAQCHPAEPDPCSSCHHDGHDPTLGPWDENHVSLVRETGSAPCMRCHEGTTCLACHEQRGVSPVVAR